MQRRDPERGGVPVTADRPPAGVGGRVVDVVCHRLLRVLLGEVVGTDPHRLPGPVPLPAGDSIVAEDLVLLWVDADERVAGRGELLDPLVDVAELGVPVRMPCPLGRA